jgi:hypothetical protein
MDELDTPYLLPIGGIGSCILLFGVYIIVLVYVFYRMTVPETNQQLTFYHPFDEWWRRGNTSISPWYQDHLFDSKRRDNLFPTYQTI